MKLDELTAFEQAQLALAVARILTQGLSVAEADVLLCLLGAVKDNAQIFIREIKKSACNNVSNGHS